MNIREYNNLYFIGIKGSGMCALAILLKKLGYKVSGSDIAESFYTDKLLEKAHIMYISGFRVENIQKNIDAVIYSAAYNIDNNVELAWAKNNLPCFSYPQALGSVSRLQSSCAVIGTHGKTTTTAFIGSLCKTLNLPVMVLTGGRVADWDNNTVWYGGNTGLIAEVCEYRNHFAHFSPNMSVFLSAEHDHPDYFKTKDDVMSAFRTFLRSLQPPQKIIACASDAGVIETLAWLDESVAENSVTTENATVADFGGALDTKQQKYKVVRYGWNYDIQATDRSASNIKTIDNVTITLQESKVGIQNFSVLGLDPYADSLQWSLLVPGKSLILNAVAALLFIREWHTQNNTSISKKEWGAVNMTLASFKGVSRRCELYLKNDKYIILDDYAHHPTAIKMTLEGIKAFYKPKRMIVDFMPHTFTRTAALLKDFMGAFGAADVLIVNEIYATAREKEHYLQQTQTGDLLDISSEGFYLKLSKAHANVYFMPKFETVVAWLQEHMQQGDLFVSMGAGDNFRISEQISKVLENVII